MVKAGYAEVYRGKPPEGFDIKQYRRNIKKAEKAKRGIWVLGDKYMNPKK